MSAPLRNPPHDPDRYLADVLQALTGATACDASVHVATRAASELAGAAALCLLSPVEERSVVCLAGRKELYRCDLRRTSLGQGKDEFIALPTGECQSIGTPCLVPLQTVCGYTAVAFLWEPGHAVDPQQLTRLQLVAKALGLAIRTWHESEELALRLEMQCRLAAELQHRLRNNLALMRSVVRRSHETAESPEEFALHLEARIGALARLQGALATAGAAGIELEDVVRTELIASAVPEKRYALQGPAVWLRAKAAESLGLAVHELATNSLKYGALGASAGKLAVVWDMTGGERPHLWLSWSESGVTIATLAPRRRGFGQELLECSLPYELNARTQLTFSPGGVHCTIEMPLEPYAATAGQPVRGVYQ